MKEPWSLREGILTYIRYHETADPLIASEQVCGMLERRLGSMIALSWGERLGEG